MTAITLTVAAADTAIPIAADASCESDPDRTVLVYAHGAGSHMEHSLILRQAGALREAGLSIVRFNFPYRATGQGRPDRMPVLLQTFAAVVAVIRDQFNPGRLLVGGQSMGGRTASMLAAGEGDDAFTCDGLILLAYPLHPPGAMDRLRAAHLPRIDVPVLCFNGTRDTLCDRATMERIVSDLPKSFTMHWIDGADHGFNVLKRSGRTVDDVFAEISRCARRWLG